MIYSNNVRLQEIKEKYRLSKIEMAENEIKLYLIENSISMVYFNKNDNI